MGKFKPGDVAMVRLDDADPEFMAMLCSFDGLFWCGVGPEGFGQFYADAADIARPLVTIDPEDRQSVERLAFEYVRTFAKGEGIAAKTVVIAAEQMQAALREFADPTPIKPDEPTGLGAVVEDTEGVRWVRFKFFELKPWRQSHLPGHCERKLATAYYADIDAVKILSDGVSADE